MTSPARAAWSTCTRPLPRANGPASVTPSSSSTPWVAAIASADLISGTLQLGCNWRTRPAAPAWCGDDIEVPL